MIINESEIYKSAHTLASAVHEIHQKVKSFADVYVLYSALTPERQKAISAQGKKLATVNKHRKEAEMPDLTEENNIAVMAHGFSGHHTTDASGLAKGLTFTASSHYNRKPVNAKFRKAAEKVAEERGLDFWGNEHAIYIGIKEGDAKQAEIKAE